MSKKVKLKNEINNDTKPVLAEVSSMEEKTWFKKGDKIIYQYDHWLNSRSKTTITKTGVFIRFVKKRGSSPYEWQPNKRVVVQLDGNKNTSTIWESEMRHFENTDKKLNISDVSDSYTDEWFLFLEEFRKTESYRKSNGQLLFPKFFEWLSSNYEVPKRKLV